MTIKDTQDHAALKRLSLPIIKILNIITADSAYDMSGLLKQVDIADINPVDPTLTEIRRTV